MNILKILLVSIFIFNTLKADEVFTLKISKKENVTYKIVQFKDLKMNELCKNSFKDCSKFFLNSSKKDMTLKKSAHSASDFCSQLGGDSEILIDSKNNEFDFCVFNKKYFLDSWVLYQKYGDQK